MQRIARAKCKKVCIEIVVKLLTMSMYGKQEKRGLTKDDKIEDVSLNNASLLAYFRD